MKIRRRSLVQSLAALPLAAQTQARSSDFASDFSSPRPRPWIGADYWSNPLQDWRVAGGRLENVVAGGDRNVFLLTRELSPRPGTLEMRVKMGAIETGGPGWAGFRVGVRGYFNDYRDSALRGLGLDAGVSSDGRLFIGELQPDAPRVSDTAELELRLASEASACTLSAWSARGQKLAELRRGDIRPDWLTGGLALVSSSGPILATPQPVQAPADASGGSKPGTQRGGNTRFWFRDWRVSGTRVVRREERSWGPVLFVQYTVSRGVLKLTAQLAPVEDFDSMVTLELQQGKPPKWEKAASVKADPDSCTAAFRVNEWDASEDVPFRVLLLRKSYPGIIRRDPVDKEKIVAGALTCQNDHGFPHTPIFRNLNFLRPDILFFTGDQIYERNGEYGIQRTPPAAARLDYLRKWFLFGWAWGELTRRTPTVCLPDDHDVFHGNVWGAGGRKAEGQGQLGQDSGGYTMPADWVNLVERTQSSHLPDPPDSAPVDQGIRVHYSHLVWGGVSFALIEDRKWKSAPKEFLPGARIVNGWPQNTQFNAARDGDVGGAQLLGDRQERFLDEWSHDWAGGVWIKAAVSATIFCNLATLPAPATTDSVVPKLPLLPLDLYPEGDVACMDHDSNAWPQTPRNRALRLLRRCLAVHIAGDQHLASTVQYGIDHWGDGPYALCPPAISNIFPRRWFPPVEGRNRKTGAPKNLGEHTDGFGNKITVHAVANPGKHGVVPEPLNDRAPGFGVVEFQRVGRRIVLTNWPRWADLTRPGAKPYPGWPVGIQMADNGMSAAQFTLGILTSELPTAVAQVIEEATGEVVFTWRLNGARFTPRVWREGLYTVRMYDAERAFERMQKGLRARRG